MMISQPQYAVKAGVPPRWINRIPWLAALWTNPVFLRSYSRGWLKATIGAGALFWLALMFAGLIHLGFSFTVGVEGAMPALTIGLWLPLSLAFLVAGIRVFILGLIRTAIEFRKDIDSNVLHDMLTTPLSDAEIFFGECMPNVIRSLYVVGQLLAFCAGLVIPAFVWTDVAAQFLYAIGGPIGSGFPGLGMMLPSVILWPIFAAVGFFLTVLMLAFSAAMYAIVFPTFGAMAAAFFHCIILYRVATIPAAVISFLGMAFTAGAPHSLMWSAFVAGELVKMLALAGLTAATALIGVAILRSHRRPGAYYGR